MNGFHSPAKFCMNGHLISSNYNTNPDFEWNYCRICGEKTIDSCPKCNDTIRGDYLESGTQQVLEGINPSQVGFCHCCGTPYPWTEKRLNAAIELAEMDEYLSEPEKEVLKKSFDDIIKDTPRTVVASTRLKQLVAKAGPELGQGLKSILITVASEGAKKILWPSP